MIPKRPSYFQDLSGGQGQTTSQLPVDHVLPHGLSPREVPWLHPWMGCASPTEAALQYPLQKQLRSFMSGGLQLPGLAWCPCQALILWIRRLGTGDFWRLQFLAFFLLALIKWFWGETTFVASSEGATWNPTWPWGTADPQSTGLPSQQWPSRRCFSSPAIYAGRCGILTAWAGQDPGQGCESLPGDDGRAAGRRSLVARAVGFEDTPGHQTWQWRMPNFLDEFSMFSKGRAPFLGISQPAMFA